MFIRLLQLITSDTTYHVKQNSLLISSWLQAEDSHTYGCSPICQGHLSCPGQLKQLCGQAHADPSLVLTKTSAQLTCSHVLLHACTVL